MTSPVLRTTSRYSDNAFPSLHTGVPSVYFFSIFSSWSSSCQYCKLQPSQSNASVLDTAGTLFFCAFLYARPLLLASSPLFSYLQLANFYIFFSLQPPPESLLCSHKIRSGSPLYALTAFCSWISYDTSLHCILISHLFS